MNMGEKMKRFLFLICLALLAFGFSSCASAPKHVPEYDSVLLGQWGVKLNDTLIKRFEFQAGGKLLQNNGTSITVMQWEGANGNGLMWGGQASAASESAAKSALAIQKAVNPLGSLLNPAKSDPDAYKTRFSYQLDGDKLSITISDQLYEVYKM